jgi:hypothetical protein
MKSVMGSIDPDHPAHLLIVSRHQLTVDSFGRPTFHPTPVAYALNHPCRGDIADPSLYAEQCCQMLAVNSEAASRLTSRGERKSKKTSLVHFGSSLVSGPWLAGPVGGP